MATFSFSRRWHFLNINSVRKTLEDDSIHTAGCSGETLLEFISAGHDIRSELSKWYINFQKWQELPHPSSHDSQSILALTYFHAISIYLSGIYDYHFEFLTLNTETPTLAQDVIQTHVDAILLQSLAALTKTNIAGILLFFPLRVVGARVTTVQGAEAILDMLAEITRRGFIVADAFTADLQHLWSCNGIW